MAIDRMLLWSGLDLLLAPLASTQFQLADKERDRRNYDSAAHHYRRGLRIRPSAWKYRVQLGHMLKEGGHLDRALAEYERARICAGRDADLCIQLAHAYKLRGDYTKATEFYGKALELGSQDDHAQRFVTRRRPPEAAPLQQKRAIWVGPDTPLARSESSRLRWLDLQVEARLGSELDMESLQPYDAVVVGGDMGLFNAVVHAFPGSCIFRSYGAPVSLTEDLWHHGLLHTVEERDNLLFALPTQEALAKEHAWIGKRSVVAPWMVPNAKELADLDEYAFPSRGGRILVPVPGDLDSPDMRRVAAFIQQDFSADCFWHVANELRPTTSIIFALDSLPGQAQATAGISELAGFFYPADQLPLLPLSVIEMLLMKVPIVFLDRGYLSSLMPPDSPGRAHSTRDAQQLCQRLAGGDVELAADMVASQEAARALFLPDEAQLQFDEAFTQLMSRAPIATRCRTPRDALMHKLMTQLLIALDRTGDERAEATSRLMRTVDYGILDRRPDDERIRTACEKVRTGWPLGKVLHEYLELGDPTKRGEKTAIYKWLFPASNRVPSRKRSGVERRLRP